AGCRAVAPSLNDSTFHRAHRALRVSCRATGLGCARPPNWSKTGGNTSPFTACSLHLVPRGRHRLRDMPSRPLRPCPNKILTTPRSRAGVPISVCPRPVPLAAGPFRGRCERFKFLPRTGRYGTCGLGSLRLDVGCFDHLAPLLGLGGNELCKVA